MKRKISPKDYWHLAFVVKLNTEKRSVTPKPLVRFKEPWFQKKKKMLTVLVYLVVFGGYKNKKTILFFIKWKVNLKKIFIYVLSLSCPISLLKLFPALCLSFNLSYWPWKDSCNTLVNLKAPRHHVGINEFYSLSAQPFC